MFPLSLTLPKKEKIIKNSIDNYSGNCPCPDYTDSAGRRCGARSAYSRKNGEEPLCYKSDITKEMIQNYKRQNALSQKN